jgi:SAM-dependent methyltransferase
MQQTIVIQTAEMMERRMIDQLRKRRVDVGLYFGEELMAQAWKEYDDKYQSTSDIADGPTRAHHGGERCVVDLGPGSGRPCLAAIKAFIEQIQEIVLIDVSQAMLSMAQDYLQRNTRAMVISIIADFFQDRDALNAGLESFPRPRLFLCLGGTVGNRDQRDALPTLRSLLGEHDYLLLDFYFYPDTRSEDFLMDLASRYVAEGNCFGLQFLMACGAEPAYRHTFASFGGDDDDPTVQVLRAFYRFPKETVLTVGNEQVTFKHGEHMQFLESRRFLESHVERHLNKYGFRVIASQRFEKYGLYLCRTV